MTESPDLRQEGNHGRWQIDPAELHRVYPVAVAGYSSDTAPGERQETPAKGSDVAPEIEMLRERPTEKDALIADLRTEHDRLLGVIETQAQQVKLLTDQRPARRRKWWPWG